jgi:hypothetical protein
MPGKPKSRNWNDIQTVLATTAIVATLGLWNLFATPSKTEIVQPSEPVLPPPTEPPVESTPSVLPQVKIYFTQTAPQTTVVQQVQQTNKKKKNKNRNNGGGSVSITQTRSS